MEQLLTTEIEITEESFSNTSYDTSPNEIRGFVNDLEALKQSFHKRLITQRFEYPIYSFWYGIDWMDLIGEDKEYVRPELIRMIKENADDDDRITDVSGFSFAFEIDECTCQFHVVSIFGEYDDEISAEV